MEPSETRDIIAELIIPDNLFIALFSRQNCFLESDDYRKNMAAGRIEVSAIGTLGTGVSIYILLGGPSAPQS